MVEIKHSPYFLKNYSNLSQVLTDKSLAALGDAYVNFVYSLALSRQTGKPCGKRVKGAPLAEALRKAGLREFLPSSIDKHAVGDAAEALLVYAWLNNLLTIEESVKELEKNAKLEKGLMHLILKVKRKTNF